MPTADELYDQAIALHEAGKTQEAIEKLEGLAGQEPGFALAHAGLSVFYGKMERFDEAIQHAQQVCQLEPEDPFSFVALSLICQKAGRLAEAEDAGMQARRLQYGM